MRLLISIIRLYALANVLCNEGGISDENVLCAALLHDTVKDTKTTPAELNRKFRENNLGHRERSHRQ